MTTETTIKQIASEIEKQFTTVTRLPEAGGDTIYVLRDGSPEWMTDIIHGVHGSSLPDDTIYEFIHDAISAITDCSADADADDCRAAVDEIEPEHRTARLYAWAMQWSEYIDQYVEEFGAFKITSSSSMTDLFQAAQALHIREVGYALIDALEQRADELNAEADEDGEESEDRPNPLYSVGQKVKAFRSINAPNLNPHAYNNGIVHSIVSTLTGYIYNVTLYDWDGTTRPYSESELQPAE